jgi:hypothetical protein
VKNESDTTIPVSFDAGVDLATGADELALIAAYLPELLKEMLAQPETEGD